MRIKKQKRKWLSVLLSLALIASLVAGISIVPGGVDIALADESNESGEQPGGEQPEVTEAPDQTEAPEESENPEETETPPPQGTPVCWTVLSTAGDVSHEEAYAYRKEEVYKAGTYYAHLYSNAWDEDDFHPIDWKTEQIENENGEIETVEVPDHDYGESSLYTAIRNDEGKVTKKEISGVTISQRKVASDSGSEYVKKYGNTWDAYSYHFYYEITISEDSNEPFVIMFDYKNEYTNSPEGTVIKSDNLGWIAKVSVRKQDELSIDAKNGENINSLSAEVGEQLYKAPNDGHNYVAKAYYYYSSMIYPNTTYDEIVSQNENGFSSKTRHWYNRGIYDKDGTPLGSHIVYQYVHIDEDGRVQTEDEDCPVSYLVYDEFPEDIEKGDSIDNAFIVETKKNDQNIIVPKWDRDSLRGYVNSCPWTDIKGNGTEVLCPVEFHDNITRIFNGDFYSVWGLYGTNIINGNVINSCALNREYQGSEKDNKRWYIGIPNWNDPNYTGDDPYFLFEHYNEAEAKTHKVFFDQMWAGDNDNLSASAASYQNASLTINGNCSYIDLSDTYEGECVVCEGGEIGGMGVCHYKDTVFSPEEAESTYYGTYIGTGQSIVQNGKFIDEIKPVDEYDDSSHYVYGVSDDMTPEDFENVNPYTVFFDGGVNGDETQGTVAVVGDTNGNGKDCISIDVSSLGDDVFPMLRPKKDNEKYAGTWKDMNSWWEIIKKILGVDKAKIMDISLVQNNARIVEPGQKVNLYIRGLDSWNGNKNVTLYHIKEDGSIEKVSTGKGNFKGTVSGSTGSFSTYFIAEDKKLPKEIDAELAKLVKEQKEEDKPVVLPTVKSVLKKGFPSNIKKPNKSAIKNTSVKVTKKNGTKTTVGVTKFTDGSVMTEKLVEEKNGTVIQSREIVYADGTNAIEIYEKNKKGKTCDKVIKVDKNKKARLTKFKTNNKKIKIPDSVKVNGKNVKIIQLGKKSISLSKKIKELRLGKNISKIDKNAITGLTKKTKIVIKAKKTQYKKIVKLLKKSIKLPKGVKIKRI